MHDVIIIGAGAAGLMASKLLSEAGKNILLLEARDRLGGRIHGIDDFSFPAQGGAEFVHGNLQTTFDLLKEAGIKKAMLKGSFCRVVKGKWTNNENIVAHWELLARKLNSQNENISVDDFLVKNFHAKKFAELRNQFRRYVQGYDAADIKYASVLAIQKEMEHEDESQYRPVPGYDALINYLAKLCLKYDGVIKTNEAVTKISLNKNIEVLTSSGKYKGEKVILAVPLGVLQSGRNSKSFISLPACLNAYTKTSKQIGNGSVIKFLLEFDNAFWLSKDFFNEKNITPPSYIFTDTAIPTWWTQYPSKVPLLTAWIGGPPAYKMRCYSKNRFKAILLESLSSIFSLSISEIEKSMVNYKVMNWIKEPHIMGGYSYSTLQTEKARQVLSKPFEDTFYFAGEYLPENSSSTVDAALLSGIQAANQILKKK